MTNAFIYFYILFLFQSYIHRSGRTARGTKEGVSVVLIDASENQFYKRMLKNCNRDDDLPQFPVDSNVSWVMEFLTCGYKISSLILSKNLKHWAYKNWA